MEPVQGWNQNRRSISGLEPEMPVTVGVGFSVAPDHSQGRMHHTHTIGRTTLDEGSTPRTDLYLYNA
jgi:hypothetical protein